MITKQESDFLIKGLMRYINKKELELLDLAEEMQNEDDENSVEHLEQDKALRVKIQFALNLIKKLEKLTDGKV